jgi:formyl-CoA transferase
VPISKIKTIAEVIDDPLVNGRLLKTKDPVSGREVVLAPPPFQTDFIVSHNRQLSFPPRFGQDNTDIYGRLGHDADALEKMKEKGII